MNPPSHLFFSVDFYRFLNEQMAGWGLDLQATQMTKEVY